MGLFSPPEKKREVRPEQKWDFITIQDFKSTSCLTPFAYGYLFFSLILSLAVYGVDSFTAINLLVFDKWSSSLAPTQIIPFTAVKWIFSICIIASFVNLGFEHVRAWRTMRRGSVAECYLDNLAVRLESARFSNGWRRFLVFAELTKSKKGAEYIALFTYFSFQSWIRVLFCSGPRQVVNALTLYAVYNSELIPTDGDTVDSTLKSFFDKIETLAESDYQEALILSGMVFTLVVWVFAMLSLILAGLFYVFFLWHYIPRQDGGLRKYCERKINKRLMKIVSVKVNKAIEKEERDRANAEAKAAKKAGLEKPTNGREATLPTLQATLPKLDMDEKDKLPEMPMLNRNDTVATLPPYTSRPSTPNGGFEMNNFNQRRPMPDRSNTLKSQSSFSSQAPLMNSAASMGMGPGRSASPAPSVPELPDIDFNNYPMTGPGAAQPNRTFSPGPLQRTQTGGSSYASSPSVYQADAMPSLPPAARSPMPQGPVDSYGRPMPRAVNQLSGRPGPPGRPPFEQGGYGRASPGPSNFPNYPSPGRASPMINGPGFNGPAFSPLRSATNPPGPPPQTMQSPPHRNMTAPVPQMQPQNYYRPQDEYFAPERPGTAQSQRNYGPPADDFFGPPQRPGTANSHRGTPQPGYGFDYDVESQRRQGY